MIVSPETKAKITQNLEPVLSNMLNNQQKTNAIIDILATEVAEKLLPKRPIKPGATINLIISEKEIQKIGNTLDKIPIAKKSTVEKATDNLKEGFKEKKEEVKQAKQDLKQDAKEVKTEAKRAKQDFKQGIKDIKTEAKKVKEETRQGFKDLKAEFRKSKAPNTLTDSTIQATDKPKSPPPQPKNPEPQKQAATQEQKRESIVIGNRPAKTAPEQATKPQLSEADRQKRQNAVADEIMKGLKTPQKHPSPELAAMAHSIGVKATHHPINPNSGQSVSQLKPVGKDQGHGGRG